MGIQRFNNKDNFVDLTDAIITNNNASLGTYVTALNVSGKGILHHILGMSYSGGTPMVKLTIDGVVIRDAQILGTAIFNKRFNSSLKIETRNASGSGSGDFIITHSLT